MVWLMRFVALLNAALIGYLAYQSRDEAGSGTLLDQTMYLVIKLWPLAIAVFGFLAVAEIIKLLRDIRNQTTI